MLRIRRDWLFEVARHFQIAALEMSMPAPALLRELPAPSTELEKLVLDGFVWRLHESRRRTAQPPPRAAIAADGNGDDAPLAIRVRDYLDRHYAGRITYRALSREFGKNPQYLETAFKAFHRISIHDYLTRVRLTAASTLIRAGEKVEFAALSVGWTKSTFFRARRRLQVTRLE